MNLRNQDNWWDWTYLVEDIAERLLRDAQRYRKDGCTLSAGQCADEMEETAWHLLDVIQKGEDVGKDKEMQEALNKAFDIMKERLFHWWD